MPCGVGAAKKAFGGLEGWQTAGLNAKKKLIDGALVPWPAGLGLPKKHLEGLRAGKRQA